MKQLSILFLILVFTTNIFGQDEFQWKNLKFGTTTEETIKKLGTPKKNEIVKAEFDKSVPVDLQKQINLRRFQYNKIDEYKKVYLLFLNEKLNSIILNPNEKKIVASKLSEIYNADFLFLEGIAKGMNFNDFEGQKETTVPKVYPAKYFMLSVKKDYTIIATINNDSWKARWRDTIKKPTLEMFPGYVEYIQIISRAEEK